MARKPSAPHLKVLAGTTRPDRQQEAGPEFDLIDVFPYPPQHLNADGAEMWQNLGPQLVKARVLQVVDLYALEQLCVAWQMFRQKAKAGMPNTAAEDTALKGLFSEFGMTPAARRKVAQSGDGAKANKFGSNGKRSAGA
jgi:phage terminase small subunit